MNATISISRQEFQLFQAFILEQSGISLDDDKTYLVESRLKRLLAEFECATFGELFRKSSEDARGGLRSKIINAITTNETLWFRDKAPFTVLNEVFLPEMARQIARGKPKVRIWSAACSTGQEPYSIAIGIHEFCLAHGGDGIRPSHFEILATDISSEALSLAREGAYDGLSMSRGMTDAVKLKYFRQNGRSWGIDANLKKLIEFRPFNLMDNFAPLGVFDAIFCRNVAIYFSQPVKAELFDKMYQCLRPGGMFLLGTSESLGYYNTRFKGREHNNHTYYQA